MYFILDEMNYPANVQYALIKDCDSIFNGSINYKDIKIAIGIDTFAYSNFPKNSGTDGRNFPIRIPIPIQRITHIVRYFSKNPIPLVFSLFIKINLPFACYIAYGRQKDYKPF